MKITDSVVKDMPERIYASISKSKGCVVGFDTPSLHYTIEYVRADIFSKPAGLEELLIRTPAIEALTPTNYEWKRCESVQDTYDLMKQKVASAIRAISAEQKEEEPS